MICVKNREHIRNKGVINMKKPIHILFLIVLMILPAALYMSCSGGGNNTESGNNQQTTINGRIENLVTVSAGSDKDSKFAHIRELFTLIKEAYAQGGISVVALVDGIPVDTDVTDGDGNFTLVLDLDSGANVSIVFEVNGDVVSIDIFVSEGSIIELVVNIDLGADPGEEVQIVDMDDERGPISCETGTVQIFKNPGEEIIVNGGGEDCIRTAGNCDLTIDPENIVLTNCDNCVDARGTSDVTLLSPDGDIVCESSEDGFRARGDASISVQAQGTIDIFAGDNGLKADGNSTITLSAGLCIIDSLEDPIDVNGNALVDTNGCQEVLTEPAPLAPPTPEPTSEP